MIPPCRPRRIASRRATGSARGRVGRPLDDPARKVAGIVARGNRLGIPTHHLARDAAAWDALAALLARLAAHPAVHFAGAATLLLGGGSEGESCHWKTHGSNCRGLYRPDQVLDGTPSGTRYGEEHR